MNSGKAPTVWIVDDDRSIRWVLEKAMNRAGIANSSFASADEALASGQHPMAVLSDIRMPGTDGLDFLDALRVKEPSLPVIIMTAHSDLDSAVSSYHRGAFEYLPKPFDIDEAVAVVQRAVAGAERQAVSGPAAAPSGEPAAAPCSAAILCAPASARSLTRTLPFCRRTW